MSGLSDSQMGSIKLSVIVRLKMLAGSQSIYDRFMLLTLCERRNHPREDKMGYCRDNGLYCV